MSLILHRAAYGRGRRLRTKFLSRRAVADSSARARRWEWQQ